MKSLITGIVALLASSMTWAQSATPTMDTGSDANTSKTYQETNAPQTKAGGFYIEPGIVAVSQDADYHASSGSGDSTGTSNALGVDVKVGGHVGETFFLGLDALYERAHFADSGYSSADANAYNWGPLVGVQAPFLGARAYASYVLDGAYDPDSGSNGLNAKFRDPYGWRFGVGFRMSAVSINLEYEDLTYRTTEIESMGSLTSEPTIDFAQRGYGLSVSFPIQL